MRDNIIKIEVDYSGDIPVMKAGNFTSDGFFLMQHRKFYGDEIGKTAKTWPSGLKEVIDYKKGYYIPKTKKYNKMLSDKLGLPPSKWIKVWNAIAYDTYIAPYKKYISTMCWPYKKHTEVVDSFWRNKHLVDQAIADGQENLIPFFVRFEEDAQTLRSAVGKGVWKTLCQNSFHKNLHLSKFNYKSIIKLANVSTGIIKYRLRPDVSVWIQHLHIKHNYKIKNVNMSLVELYHDTEHMARQLEKPFNDKWSLKRMKEQHDLYSQELLAREYSDEPFSGLPNDIIEQLSCIDTKLTATLLRSPMSLKLEGNAMRHCVANYKDQCEKGEYIVYSITDVEGNRVSTLGIRLTTTGYHFHQHYGYGNSKVSDETAKFGTNIIVYLNKMNRSLK